MLCLAEQAAGQFALHSVSSRVARLLLDESGAPALALSHRELASRIGCSRETVTRALGRLERSGTITIGRRQIRVLNLEKLRVVADSPE